MMHVMAKELGDAFFGDFKVTGFSKMLFFGEFCVCSSSGFLLQPLFHSFRIIYRSIDSTVLSVQL